MLSAIRNWLTVGPQEIFSLSAFTPVLRAKCVRVPRKRGPAIRGCGTLTLTEVRHEMVVKPPKSFKISLGSRKVCTTF
jgi:hypothetical protein